jgi:bacterioferritin
VAANAEVVRTLNGLLTVELRAINQYFMDYKLAGHHGFEYLAEKFRQASFEEMNDAEKLMDRILLLGGLPNLQRVEPFQVGETVAEQFQLALELERNAVELLKQAITLAEDTDDPGTGTMLRAMLLEEEEQVSWLEAQIALVGQLGEANYLAQQVRP